jgi:putative NADH-flavin reductase
MKITIVAATGGIGRLALERALAAGHDVTAVARRPASLPVGPRPVTADLLAAGPAVHAALTDAVTGADAVISALGPRTAADLGVVSRGTQAVIDAMADTGGRRLLVVSAGPIGTVASPDRPRPSRSDPGDGIVVRTLLAPLVKRVLRQPYADLARMEDAVRASDLDWTIVRPPRLVDGPPSAAYRTAYDQNVRRGLSVRRADVADLLVRLVDEPASVRHTVGVAR